MTKEVLYAPAYDNERAVNGQYWIQVNINRKFKLKYDFCTHNFCFVYENGEEYNFGTMHTWEE